MIRGQYAGMVAALAGVVGLFLHSTLVSAGESEMAALRPSQTSSGINAGWLLRLPPEEPVAFRGVVSYDQAGLGTAAMMYPAPNVGGLLAAVITHALLVEAAKKDQKTKMQEAADMVLVPYQTVLDGFNHRDLMRRALEKVTVSAKGKLIEASGKSVTEIMVSSAPIFSLTQDQGAIVLDNIVGIFMPGAESGPGFTIRIVSTGKDAPDLVAFWTANDGEQLKEESARLVAQSLDIAFGEVAVEADREAIPFRTIRYREGLTEKIERAQILSNQCGRLLIRTLRGVLMSVPASRTAAELASTSHCNPSPVASPK